MKVAALIPCRKGSKGVVGKNFKEFFGKPLFEWTLQAARDSMIFDTVILSSDGGFGESKNHGDVVIIDNDRPEEHATDEARLDPLLEYYCNKYPEIDVWCLLQPTSPLRTAQDIKGAYKMILKKKYDSVVSVYPEKGFYWIKDSIGFMGKKASIATYHIDKRPNRQDRKNWFMENGAIYFTNKYAIKATGHRLGGEIGLYEMTKENSFEIDDKTDWAICEFLAKRRAS